MTRHSKKLQYSLISSTEPFCLISSPDAFCSWKATCHLVFASSLYLPCSSEIIPPNKSFSLEVLIQPIFLQNWANKIGKWVSDEEYCFAAVDKDIIKSYMLLGFWLPLNLHVCPFLHLLMPSHLRLSCSE